MFFEKMKGNVERRSGSYGSNFTGQQI